MTQNVNDLTAFFVNSFYDDLPKVKASTGFLSRWGKGPGSITVRVNDALEFSMDIVRNKKVIATLYPRSQAEAMTNLGSNVKTRTGQTFENVARDFPIIKLLASVSYDEAMKYRLPGELAVKENQSDGSAIITKAGIELGRSVKVNMVSAVGRMELMAAQALRLGIITLDDGSTYNFGRASTNTDTVTVAWSNVATATPFADMSAHYTVIRRNGKGDPRAVVMAGDAFKEFLETDEVRNSADNRDVSFVRAGATEFAQLPVPDFVADMEANGFSYMAFYKDLQTGRKMYIFVYDEDYQNSAGTWVNYMPAGKVLFFDPDMRLDRFFGPRTRFNYETPEEMMIKRMFGIESAVAMPENLGNGNIESWMFHHDVITNGSEKTNISVESYTGPIYAPTEVDSAGELTV
jgi:hypothetical protein